MEKEFRNEKKRPLTLSVIFNVGSGLRYSCRCRGSPSFKTRAEPVSAILPNMCSGGLVVT